MLTARLQGISRQKPIRRTFLVGANPFVLKSQRLLTIADWIHEYIPSVNTIGCFARITDIAIKSDEEPASLHQAGYDGLTIGIETGAKATADVCNQLHPTRIGVNMLTIYPDSELYLEIQRGAWKEAGELEKYKEIRTLLENLEIPTQFAALGASNAFQFQGTLPEDKDALIAALDKIIETAAEDDLREYRVHLPHL